MASSGQSAGSSLETWDIDQSLREKMGVPKWKWGQGRSSRTQRRRASRTQALTREKDLDHTQDTRSSQVRQMALGEWGWGSYSKPSPMGGHWPWPGHNGRKCGSGQSFSIHILFLLFCLMG